MTQSLAEFHIEEHRTYTRAELIGSFAWLDGHFWLFLVDCFGLIPLGSDKDQIVHGRNLLEALQNHARGELVEPRRHPITRAKLRKIRKQLKLESEDDD